MSAQFAYYIDVHALSPSPQAGKGVWMDEPLGSYLHTGADLVVLYARKLVVFQRPDPFEALLIKLAAGNISRLQACFWS